MNERQAAQHIDHWRERAMRAERAGNQIPHLVACLERIPCQMTTTIEDCDVAVGTHVRHPDRYEKLPRGEWCDRCEALATARELNGESA